MSAVVTVIIPVGPRHLGHVNDAVRSCEQQTFTHIKVDVIHDDERRGASWARNQGIKKATTPYVVFLDADDALTNTGIEMLLKGAAMYPEASYIYGDSWTMENGGITGAFVAGEFDRAQMLRGNLHNVTALVQTYAAQQIKFDPMIKGWEDWDFYVRLALAGYCGKRVVSPIITYRLDAGSNRADSAKIQNLYASIFTKYHGVIPMGCCGSRPENVQAAAEAMKLQPGGMIKMDYVGANVGAIPIRVNGRIYRGAADGVNNFAWVDPRDVAQLLETELWRMAPTPSVDTKPFDFSTLAIPDVPMSDSIEPSLIADSIAPAAQAEDLPGQTPFSPPIKTGKRARR